MIDMSHMIKFV